MVVGNWLVEGADAGLAYVNGWLVVGGTDW